MNTQSVRDAFRSTFGRAAKGVVSAPGRVNLIGEHTDYNDGFVLPIAIEKQTLGAWAPRDDGRVAFASLQQPGQGVEIDLCEPITPYESAWANYPKGVALELSRAGVELAGCDVLFDSDVPLNAGLSSSASLEVAAALALLTAAGATLPPAQLAKLCQRAENDFAGAPCGIMDQSISVMGQAGHALLLDCRSLETKHVPFNDPQAVLLVADTRVKHDIGDGGYPERRGQCEESAAVLGVRALRDATISQARIALEAGQLSEKHFLRCRHVIGEIARTLEAVEALRADDLTRFGELMYASHASLRDDYEVSCEELDAIVKAAKGCEGVFGARMTGGGFGGCAIVLVRADRAEAVRDAIIAQFQVRFGRDCPIFATHAAAGACVVE
ncbi:MAG: galactokinase [Phycisphaerae bacterium]|nr:galactokinase [Phycisphaerae bacterium]